VTEVWKSVLVSLLDREAVEENTMVQDKRESWSNVDVIVLDRHLAYLDRLATDMQLKYGRAILRHEVIRALIEWALAHADSASLEESLVQFAGTIGEGESA
jgi:hypothetical protein